jgi:hypothetical protein
VLATSTQIVFLEGNNFSINIPLRTIQINEANKLAEIKYVMLVNGLEVIEVLNADGKSFHAIIPER